MQWIVPITAIPGIALIVLSTSSLLISLNKEISLLNLEKEKYREIIDLKIIQLKRLNWALVLLYIGILFFLAIILLIIYGFKSIYIRQKHLKL